MGDANTQVMKSDQQQSAPEHGSGYLLLLLLSLLFALLVTPVLGDVIEGENPILAYTGITAVLVIGVFVNRRRKKLFLPCLVLAVLGVLTIWSTLILDYSFVFVASCILEAVFYATIAVLLVIQILRRYLATVQSIFGALCVYLLFGLAWAQLYWAAERIDDQSIKFPRSIVAAEDADEEQKTRYSQVVYFSFVTMSSLGYGDVVPAKPLAQTLAWMQSVLGQFFLAVLVAWLVSALPRHGPLKGNSIKEADTEVDECTD